MQCDAVITSSSHKVSKLRSIHSCFHRSKKCKNWSRIITVVAEKEVDPF